MKSKLLQKKNYGVNQAREVVDGQQENDSSRPTKGHNTAPNHVNPAVDAQQQILQTIHTAATCTG
jgi:hypothetical protein